MTESMSHMGSETGITKDIGKKIKQLRTDQGLTLEKLGQRVGCTKAYISQLEHGVSKPSVSMLGRFSEALGVPVSELLAQENGGRKKDWKLGRSERKTIYYPDGKVVSQLLTRRIFQKKMQPLISEIKPGGRLDRNDRMRHPPGTEEFVLVLKGELVFMLAEESLLLKKGDTLYFNGDLAHQWINRGKTTAVVLFVWTPPVW